MTSNPGVYRMHDSDNKVIYVGKAKNLKKRVSSYFGNSQKDRKTGQIKKLTDQIETFSTKNEVEALLLEQLLIRENKPKFNILLRDDKTYPWICIKNEFFPRIFYTRKKIKDGSSYFGPYPSVKVVKTVLELVKDNFDIRTCEHQLNKEKIESGVFKTSVDFYIGNCKGCCQGEVGIGEYDQRISNVKQVLNGHTSKVLKSMRFKMQNHASKYQFEEAEKIKRKIKNIEKFQSKSVVVDSNLSYLGVINIVSHEKYAFVNAIQVMNGAITKSKTTVVQKKLDETDPEILYFLLAENINNFFGKMLEGIIGSYNKHQPEY